MYQEGHVGSISSLFCFIAHEAAADVAKDAANVYIQFLNC